MRTSRRFSRSVEIGRWHRLCRFRQTDKIHSLLTEDADLARVDDQLGEREKFVFALCTDRSLDGFSSAALEFVEDSARQDV